MFGTLNLDEFIRLRKEPSRWLPAALDIARSHGLSCAEPQAFATGTNLVAALDAEHILKIFPPMLRHQFTSERASLALLHGRLSVDVPRTVVEGERDGWPYFVMTRLAGVTGAEVWPGLDEVAKERLLGRVGEVIAEVQRVPPGELLLLDPQWDTFLARQIEGCRARHERLGLPDKYLVDLDDYLRDARRLFPGRHRRSS